MSKKRALDSKFTEGRTLRKKPRITYEEEETISESYDDRSSSSSESTTDNQFVIKNEVEMDESSEYSHDKSSSSSESSASYDFSEISISDEIDQNELIETNTTSNKKSLNIDLIEDAEIKSEVIDITNNKKKKHINIPEYVEKTNDLIRESNNTIMFYYEQNGIYIPYVQYMKSITYHNKHEIGSMSFIINTDFLWTNLMSSEIKLLKKSFEIRTYMNNEQLMNMNKCVIINGDNITNFTIEKNNAGKLRIRFNTKKFIDFMTIIKGSEIGNTRTGIDNFMVYDKKQMTICFKYDFIDYVIKLNVVTCATGRCKKITGQASNKGSYKKIMDKLIGMNFHREISKKSDGNSDDVWLMADKFMDNMEKELENDMHNNDFIPQHSLGIDINFLHRMSCENILTYTMLDSLIGSLLVKTQKNISGLSFIDFIRRTIGTRSLDDVMSELFGSDRLRMILNMYVLFNNPNFRGTCDDVMSFSDKIEKDGYAFVIVKDLLTLQTDSYCIVSITHDLCVARYIFSEEKSTFICKKVDILGENNIALPCPFGKIVMNY